MSWNSYAHPNHIQAAAKCLLAGAGKTVLAYGGLVQRFEEEMLIDFRSAVIDRLDKTFDKSDVGIAFIYCSYKERDSQNAANLVGSLLQQLVNQRKSIPEEISTLYHKYAPQNTRPSLSECSELLQKQVASYKRVIIVIDALDECDDTNSTRDIIVAELHRLPSNVQLLVTSRPLTSIGESLDYSRRLQISASEDDVELYINARLETQPQLARHIKKEPALKDHILKRLVEKVKGM